jgi:hypothetical protein
MSSVRLWIALTLALSCAVLQAGEKEILMKLSGQQPSGSFASADPATGLVLNGSFNATILPAGSEAVFAFWSVCLPPPPPPPGEPPPFPPPPPLCPVMAAGLLPSSTVKVQTGGSVVEIDFDTSKMILPLGVTGPSSWKGVFRRTTGVFSFTLEATGNQTSTNIVPGFPDPASTFTFIQRTTGNREQSSASFAGTVASHTVVPVPGVSNGNLLIHHGGTASILMRDR